jgi:hypothetical protein
MLTQEVTVGSYLRADAVERARDEASTAKMTGTIVTVAGGLITLLGLVSVIVLAPRQEERRS